MRYWLVMPAAGASQRFGGTRPKQHMALAGRTVLEVALQLFIDDARCAGIALALDPDALADVALRRRLLLQRSSRVRARSGHWDHAPDPIRPFELRQRPCAQGQSQSYG